jgi:hypothetical protein
MGDADVSYKTRVVIGRASHSLIKLTVSPITFIHHLLFYFTTSIVRWQETKSS